MARRIELRGIANALNESFVSRNNDFRGYWTIGQLKSFAIDNGLSSMEFSLNIPKTDSIFNLQNYIVRHYRGMLGHLRMAALRRVLTLDPLLIQIRRQYLLRPRHKTAYAARQVLPVRDDE